MRESVLCLHALAQLSVTYSSAATDQDQELIPTVPQFYTELYMAQSQIILVNSPLSSLASQIHWFWLFAV